jgi:branched-chain amino acid transport system permease protein
MIIRPEGLLPSRRRRAELSEGTGGMGTMGGEVGAVATQAHEPEVVSSADVIEDGQR